MRHIDDVAPDGASLVFDQFGENNVLSLWVLPLTANATPRELFPTKTPVAEARFSPDGRWIAYSGMENGRWETFVMSLARGSRWQISTTGGWAATWRRDGRVLYFTSLKDGGAMMEATLEFQGEELKASTPRPLFKYVSASTSFWSIPAQASSDGSRFIARTVDPQHGNALNLVLNWQSLLNK